MSNVLLFIYRLNGGGAERVVSNLSFALEEKHNVTIAIYSSEKVQYPYKGKLIKIQLPYSSDILHNNIFKRFLRFILLIYKLRRIKRQYRINISISFGEQASIINILSRSGERIILSIRTTLSKYLQMSPKTKALTLFFKYLYNHSNLIIVPSKVAAKDLIENFRIREEKITVIYNYINSEAIKKLAFEEFDDPNLISLFNYRILLNVGRISPAKGQWLLFHLIKRLRSKYSDIKLVIIGDLKSEVDFKYKLESYGRALGLTIYDKSNKEMQFSLEYDVFLLGFETNPFKYLSKSELLVFPSTFEGFPNTLIEAMESGLPVISSDCQSGPREIIAPETDPTKHTLKTEMHQCGILAPSLPSSSIEDPINETIIYEWEYAINMLLKNNELRISYKNEGFKRAIYFEQNTILKSWEKIISG
jgi:Glycosyltransferase